MNQRAGDAVLAIGVDLVEVGRVRQLLERFPERFAARVCTEAEADYCRRGARPAERFAVRFAAKEAVMKALGTGWDRGITFRDIEVIRAPGGAPMLRLHGEARLHADRLGVTRTALSLSHTAEHAVAMVVFSVGAGAEGV